MADKVEPKKIKSKELGCEVTLNPNGEFSITNQDLYSFYEAHGVPDAKAVLSKINEARGALIEAGATFLKPHVIKDKERKILNCGMAENKVEIMLNGKTTNLNPQTKEEVVSYGTVRVKYASKVPSVLVKEGGVLSEISKEIAKALK